MIGQSQQKQLYEKTYSQQALLGRGAYGSAYSVKNNNDGSVYVAKKMQLEGLPEKDKNLAWGEIEILKKVSEMKIPFIVEYKECFHFQNTLIIIMEYCEHGDLQTFLKNWKKKGELLDEKVVVNWFIQLLFGVKALHSKNVLHRDLKSANIFLTSNKTLKIGDFGISKVLDNTSAKTFVGTPYYLSPEVCSNQPYSLASDLWALGCIVYQMCTLTYPFQGSNIFGLAVKIITQEVKPLPKDYSDDLNSIVMKMFIKNQKQRITIDEILKMPFMKKHMATFVQDQEKINSLIAIGKKQIKPQQYDEEGQKSIKQLNSTDDNQDTMKTLNTVLVNTRGKQSSSSTLNYSQSLTPGERLKLKKQQQARERQQIMREEIMKNTGTVNFAKEKKYQNLANSGTNFNGSKSFGQTMQKSAQLQKQFQHQNRQKAQLKMTKQRLQKMQVINTQQLSQSINQLITKKAYNQPTHQQSQPHTTTYGLQNLNNSMKNTYLDDRPIKPSKNQKYQVEEDIYQQTSDDDDYGDEELEEYYDQGFQDYIEEEDNGDQKMKSTATKQQFEDIMAFYDDFAGRSSISPTKKSKIAQVFKAQQITIPTSAKKRIQSKVQKCKEIVGQKKYSQLYKKVSNQQIDYKTIKKQFTSDQINAIHMIEEIVYEEKMN